MLSLPTLINQLNSKQSAWVENRLLDQVNFNRPSLALFNALRSGKDIYEVQRQLDLNEDQFSIVIRPVYNAILELYGLSPSSSKDALSSEVFYAIYKRSYKNSSEQINTLERLFHEMKKHQIEQDSSVLLNKIYQLQVGSPLQAVYHHLYLKYKKIEEVNAKAVEHFETLNKNLSVYFQNPTDREAVKAMIYSFKLIRALYEQAENRTLEAILKLSKLILVDLCGQHQLLRDGKLSKKDLISDCSTLVEMLPFGVNRFFLKNILQSLLANDTSIEKEGSLGCIHNFHFRLLQHPEEETQKTYSFPETIEILTSSFNDAKKKLIRQTVSSFSIPRDSWSTSSTKLIG
jgi:hypothetical protein